MLAAKAARRRRRGRATPVAVRRALHADRWLPRYYRVVRRALDRIVRQVSRDARAGVDAGQATSHVVQWSTALAETKRKWMYAVAQEGWNLAGLELVFQVGKWKSVEDLLSPDATFWLPGAKQVEVGHKPEDFLLVGRFDDIDEWVDTTSLAEAGTEADRLARIWRDAERSRDAETGRAWTVPQIADAIERRGIADSAHRANLLARTGTIWAINEGAQQRYRAAGVEAEEWLTTEDDVACPWCMQMDGKIVRTDDPFWRRGSEFGVPTPKGIRTLKLPFAVQHPPLHPYCRCTLIPVITEADAL